MTDFSAIRLEVAGTTRSSFVGIIRTGGEMVFRLPLGFDALAAGIEQFDTAARYAAVRDLFFLLYKVLRVYSEVGHSTGDNSPNRQLQDTKVSDGETFGSAPHSDAWSEDKEPVVTFSSLDLIDGILAVYDEPRLLGLLRRLSEHEEPDYQQIHRFLHRAVFLEDGTAMLDRMSIPVARVTAHATDLVRIYCYVFSEISEYLGRRPRDAIRALADDFRHRHLAPGDRLFDPLTWRQTHDSLRDMLERVDRLTALKDGDYWDFFLALDRFLSGTRNKGGDLRWGVSGFAQIWEAACLETALAEDRLNIEYVDPENLRPTPRGDVERRAQRMGAWVPRAFGRMRPDLVARSATNEPLIADVKYRRDNDFDGDPLRAAIKQFVYGWVLRKHLGLAEGAALRNEMWLPGPGDTSKPLLVSISVAGVLEYLNSLKSPLSESAEELYNRCSALLSNTLGHSAEITLRDVEFTLVVKDAQRTLDAYVRAAERSYV